MERLNGCRNSSAGKALDSWPKGDKKIQHPSRSSGIIFFFGVIILYWLLIDVRFNFVLYAAAVRKGLKPFCQKYGWQVTRKHSHIWLKQVGVSWWYCSSMVLEPIRETSSQTTHRGTLVYSRLSLLRHCGLILAYRLELMRASWSRFFFFNMARRGKSRRTFPQNPRTRRSLFHLNGRKC